MWSSQGGSLLLWAWVLSIASSAVLFATRNKHREIVPWATAVLMGFGAFFCGLMLLGGRLADLLGRRRMFLAGLTTFFGRLVERGRGPNGTLAFLPAA